MIASTPIRFAILGTRGIPAKYGGFETFAEELASRLIRKNIAITVYCVKGERHQPAEYRGITLKYVVSPKAGPLTTVLFDLFCLWHARKSFDVVYMLGYGASGFCFLPRLWGTKVWINLDGIEWARAKWSTLAKIYFKVMEAIAVRIADRVIADAEGILNIMQERHGQLPSCSVIPYGAPVIENAPAVLLLDRWNVKPNQYYLVVCRLEPENHVQEILQGHVRSTTSLPLIVVGDHRSGTGYVRDLLAVNDDRVRFIGTVYEKNVLQCLRFHCKAYYHGHSVGGTNPSLLEAMGCGNIVIAHDNVFNREVAGECAHYFSTHDDIPKIIDTVESMDDRDLESHRSAARKRMHEQYSWDRITDAYYTILKKP